LQYHKRSYILSLGNTEKITAKENIAIRLSSNSLLLTVNILSFENAHKFNEGVA
jgi:hypothetical protein